MPDAPLRYVRAGPAPARTVLTPGGCGYVGLHVAAELLDPLALRSLFAGFAIDVVIRGAGLKAVAEPVRLTKPRLAAQGDRATQVAQR